MSVPFSRSRWRTDASMENVLHRTYLTRNINSKNTYLCILIKVLTSFCHSQKDEETLVCFHSQGRISNYRPFSQVPNRTRKTKFQIMISPFSSFVFPIFSQQPIRAMSHSTQLQFEPCS